MKYILIFVMWSVAQGGAPAAAEFDDEAACIAAAQEIKTKLMDSLRPGGWYVRCWPKGTLK